MDLARRVYSRKLKPAAMREIDSRRTISEVAGKDSLFGLCPHFPANHFYRTWRLTDSSVYVTI